VTLAHDFADATTSDIDSIRELWGLANAVRGARVDRVSIDVSDFTAYGADYLTADEGALKAAVRQLFGLPPAKAPGATRTVAAAPVTSVAPPPKPVLYSDGGRAASLLEPLVPRMRRCVPTELPPGYGWPDDEPARAYALDGHPAVALYATSGSGHSLLWMFT